MSFPRYEKYKDSGVPWLGEVPEHWEIVRLGRLVVLLTGFPFKSDGFTQIEEDTRVLRGVNISPGAIRWSDVVRWPLADCGDYEEYKLRAGDIILGMDRPIIRGGTRVAVIEDADLPSLLCQRVARFRQKEMIRTELITMILSGKAFKDYLTPIFTGISVPHLSPEQIKSFRFALPGLVEQNKIVDYVTTRTIKTHALAQVAENKINLLREYRTRLIADVVTGKLDVREAAARLPEEIDEPEPLDEPDAEGGAEGLGENDDDEATEEAEDEL